MAPVEPARISGRRYVNQTATAIAGLSTTAHYFARALRERRRGEPVGPLGPFHTDPRLFAQPPASGLRVTWMGHATVWVELDGARILIDPVWGRRASPVSFMGPKRFYSPTLALSQMPPADIVLLSHDHYDHLDRPTIKALSRLPGAPRFVCPLGVGALLANWGIPRARIAELNWGESTAIHGVTITATPARHFSGRSLWDRNRTLWCSYAMRGSSHDLFYSGDSGATAAFARIGSAYGPFDLTLMAIGAYDRGWPAIHLDPEQAIDAHLALGGRLLLPVHWGLFNLAFHRWQEPVERLVTEAARRNVPLLLPAPGSPTEITGAPLNSLWWEKRFLSAPTHSSIPATPASVSPSH